MMRQQKREKPESKRFAILTDRPAEKNKLLPLIQQHNTPDFSINRPGLGIDRRWCRPARNSFFESVGPAKPSSAEDFTTQPERFLSLRRSCARSCWRTLRRSCRTPRPLPSIGGKRRGEEPHQNLRHDRVERETQKRSSSAQRGRDDQTIGHRRRVELEAILARGSSSTCTSPFTAPGVKTSAFSVSWTGHFPDFCRPEL